MLVPLSSLPRLQNVRITRDAPGFLGITRFSRPKATVKWVNAWRSSQDEMESLDEDPSGFVGRPEKIRYFRDVKTVKGPSRSI